MNDEALNKVTISAAPGVDHTTTEQAKRDLLSTNHRKTFQDAVKSATVNVRPGERAHR